MAASNLRQRPGLAKARLPWLARRQRLALRVEDSVWRTLLEQADVVSEGSMRNEADGPVWYGSTSLIVDLGWLERAGHGSADRSLIASMAEHDLHVRVRVTRIARREASSRALVDGAVLGRFSCEVRFSTVARGLRIDVDVQAPFIEGRQKAIPHP